MTAKEAGTPRDWFEISARSIAITEQDCIITVVLFKPTPASLRRLRCLRQGDFLGPVRFIDKFDDGVEDVFVNGTNHSFISLKDSGDMRKTHTFIITLYRSHLVSENKTVSKETARFEALPKHGIRHG